MELRLRWFPSFLGRLLSFFLLVAVVGDLDLSVASSYLGIYLLKELTLSDIQREVLQLSTYIP